MDAKNLQVRVQSKNWKLEIDQKGCICSVQSDLLTNAQSSELIELMKSAFEQYRQKLVLHLNQ